MTSIRWSEVILVLTLTLGLISGLSDLRRCADQSCSKPVAAGRTILRYHAKSPELLSFGVDQKVLIFSKEAGTDKDLWGVEINGRRGYVNRRHVQETKVMVRHLPFEVPTSNAGAVPNIPNAPNRPQTQPPQEEKPEVQPEAQPEPIEVENVNVDQPPLTGLPPSPLNETEDPQASPPGEEPSFPTPPSPTQGAATPTLEEPGSVSGESLNPEIISSIEPPPANPAAGNASPLFPPNPLDPDTPLAGAHATQVSLSPEDMEYNRMRASFANADGDFVLESSIDATQQILSSTTISPLDSLPSISLFSPVSAEESVPPSQPELEPNVEVIDGTTFRLDDPPATINEQPVAKPTENLEIQPTATQPDIKASVDPTPLPPSIPEDIEGTVPPPVEETPQTVPPPVEPSEAQEATAPLPSDMHADPSGATAPTPVVIGDAEKIDNSASPGTIDEKPEIVEEVLDIDNKSEDLKEELGEDFDDYYEDEGMQAEEFDGEEDEEDDEEEPEDEKSAEERKQRIQEQLQHEAEKEAEVQAEQLRLEQEKLEEERLEKEKLEQERLEKEKLEQEKLEQEKLEQEKLEQEKLEQEKLEQEKLEQEKLEQEKLEQEKLEQERLEKEKIEQEKLEQQRLEQEKLEQQRLEQERLDKEKLEQEKLEQERLEQEKLEQEKPRDAFDDFPPLDPQVDKTEAETVENVVDSSDKAPEQQEVVANEAENVNQIEPVDNSATFMRDDGNTPQEELEKEEAQQEAGLFSSFFGSSTTGNEEPAPSETPEEPSEPVTETPQDPVTENPEAVTDIPQDPYASVTENPDVVTEFPQDPYASVTEAPEAVTEANEAVTEPEFVPVTDPNQVPVPQVPDDYVVPIPPGGEEIKFHDPNAGLEPTDPYQQEPVLSDPYAKQDQPSVDENNNTEPPKEDDTNNGNVEDQIPDENETENEDDSDREKRDVEPEANGDLEEAVAQENPEAVVTEKEEETVHEDVPPKDETVYENIDHFAEAQSGGILPSFLVDLFGGHGHGHGEDQGQDGVSGTMYAITGALIVFFGVIYLATLLAENGRFNTPLLEKLSKLEKELFQVKNESAIIKREAEQFLKNGGIKSAPEPVKVVTNEPPTQLLEEIRELRETNSKLTMSGQTFESEKAELMRERESLLEEKARLQNLYDQAQQELNESEAIVQECLEEKKRGSANHIDVDLSNAIDKLRSQLMAQQEAVGKYEAKIRKRESELKAKTQELRKLRADAANAKLEVTKVTQDKDEVTRKLAVLEKASEENEALKNSLATLQTNYDNLSEAMEVKESELEAKITEVEVNEVTIEQLKAMTEAAANNNHHKSKRDVSEAPGDEGDGDGWDCEDDLPLDSEVSESAAVDFSSLHDTAVLKVDLRKAQEACEKLSDQLMSAEETRDRFEEQLKVNADELETARKVRENSLKEKEALGKKLEVLTTYFNTREAELQKQLGMTANRLTDTESSSSTAENRIAILQSEVESYKSQLATLKKEMEEQERSLKTQNATLEKKQHESWVTVRQESRRSAEAQNEMQTLRTRLTTVESKLVEKEFEITKLAEENESLKETVETISRQSIPKNEPVYTNGNNSSASSAAGDGHPSLPDLPPLPMLPSLPLGPMATAAPPAAAGYMPYLPPVDGIRPAPLGRRSPGPRGYSPSPPHSDDYYPSPAGSGRYRRDSSRSPDRERRRGGYESGRYDRYARDRSPDRMSNRSGRSDRSSRYD